MNVLDIDLDFFLDRRPDVGARNGGRLSPKEYRPWSAHEVERYLTDRCHLRKGARMPGAVVCHHHEVFDCWRALKASGRLTLKFHLTHVDSHADMGMGDAGLGYIMGELLHHNLQARESPQGNDVWALGEGNFISFAIACRWIASVTYVHHPDLVRENCCIHDIPDVLFPDNDPHRHVLQLKRLPRGCRLGVQRLTQIKPEAFEPEVPLRLVKCDTFDADVPFDFVFVTQSPKYTPPSCDRLLPVIGKFIQ